jgi:hypothetical protein
MSRTLVWLNIGLVIIVGWLAFNVWQQHAQRDAWQQKVGTSTNRVAELKAKAAEAAARARQGQHSSPKPATNGATSTRDEDATARLMADLQKRKFRMNALHSYAAGFEALHLPPEIVARAKEIILERTEAVTNSIARRRSAEEAVAAMESFTNAERVQLTALLGPHNYEQLQAYRRESPMDWTIGTDMWDGGAPLSPEQLHGLALAAEQTKFESPSNSITTNPNQIPDTATGLSAQDSAMLEASRQFLTRAQQEILRQNLVDENRYHAAMRAFAAKQRALLENSR